MEGLQSMFILPYCVHAEHSNLLRKLLSLGILAHPCDTSRQGLQCLMNLVQVHYCLRSWSYVT